MKFYFCILGLKMVYNHQEGSDQILKKVKIKQTDIQLSLGIDLIRCVFNQTFFFVQKECDKKDGSFDLYEI